MPSLVVNARSRGCAADASGEPARGVSAVWALVAVAAVLYGSLLPFDID